MIPILYFINTNKNIVNAELDNYDMDNKLTLNGSSDYIINANKYVFGNLVYQLTILMHGILILFIMFNFVEFFYYESNSKKLAIYKLLV